MLIGDATLIVKPSTRARAQTDHSLADALINKVVVAIDVQGLVPVLVDMVRPVEFPLDNPAAILSAENGWFSWYYVVVEQASIKPIAFVVGNEIGIGISAGSTAAKMARSV